MPLPAVVRSTLGAVGDFLVTVLLSPLPRVEYACPPQRIGIESRVTLDELGLWNGAVSSFFQSLMLTKLLKHGESFPLCD
jgi:hypothetical protein